MNLDLLDERRFSEEMTERVEPFLTRIRTCRVLTTPDGGALYTETYPVESPRGGVLIVHGFTETAEKYREMTWYFLQQGFSVYLYDGRGHGRSSRGAETPDVVHIDDFSTYVRDLDQVLHQVARPANGGRPLFLFGHSMGGATAALHLLRHPGAFDRAVLSSPMVAPRTFVPGALAGAIARAMIRRGRGRDRIFIFRGDPAEKTFEQSACDSRARFGYYADLCRRNPRLRIGGGSWAWLAAALRASRELLRPGNAARIRIPLLLLQAGRDRYVVPGAQHRFVNALPCGRILRWPDARHELYRMANPDLEGYLRAVLEFLDGSGVAQTSSRFF